MIQCVCSYFNFTNNPLRKNLYIEFRKKFSHPIITIEIALDKSQFFIDDSYKVLASKENILWQKERSFNIVLENLSDKYNKIVWIDTDIIFHNENWLKDTEDCLEDNLMCQPFESVFEFSPNSNTLSSNEPLNTYGWAKCFNESLNNDYQIPRITAMGLSWAIRRECIPNGFFDQHILGSNDVLQVLSVLGDGFNNQLTNTCTKKLLQHWVNYAINMPPFKKYNIGYCQGSVQHLFHGNTNHRGYQIREKLLNDYSFDPHKHLQIDKNKLYRIVNDQILSDKIYEYFQIRHMATMNNMI